MDVSVIAYRGIEFILKLCLPVSRGGFFDKKLLSARNLKGGKEKWQRLN